MLFSHRVRQSGRKLEEDRFELGTNFLFFVKIPIIKKFEEIYEIQIEFLRSKCRCNQDLIFLHIRPLLCPRGKITGKVDENTRITGEKIVNLLKLVKKKIGLACMY